MGVEGGRKDTKILRDGVVKIPESLCYNFKVIEFLPQTQILISYIFATYAIGLQRYRN